MSEEKLLVRMSVVAHKNAYVVEIMLWEDGPGVSLWMLVDPDMLDSGVGIDFSLSEVDEFVKAMYQGMPMNGVAIPVANEDVPFVAGVLYNAAFRASAYLELIGYKSLKEVYGDDLT